MPSTIKTVAALMAASLFTHLASAQGCTTFTQVAENYTRIFRHSMRVSDARTCSSDDADYNTANESCPLQAWAYARVDMRVNHTAFTDEEGDFDAIATSLDAFFEAVDLPPERAVMTGIVPNGTYHVKADMQGYVRFWEYYDCYPGVFGGCEQGFLGDEEEVVLVCVPLSKGNGAEDSPPVFDGIEHVVHVGLNLVEQMGPNVYAEPPEGWEPGFSEFLERSEDEDSGDGSDGGDDSDEDSGGSRLCFEPSVLMVGGIASLLSWGLAS